MPGLTKSNKSAVFYIFLRLKLHKTNPETTLKHNNKFNYKEHVGKMVLHRFSERF